MSKRFICSICCVVFLGASCDRAVSPPASQEPDKAEPVTATGTPAKEAEQKVAAPPVVLPPVSARLQGIERVVAIGDIHGDFSAMETALKGAKLIDDEGRWTGQDTVLVQTGDLLDRGDDEQRIIDFLDRLGAEARAEGGNVLELIGNHEAMNVQGDLRYVTPGGFEDFEDVEGLDLSDERLAPLSPPLRARRAAFLPGGPYARKLAEHHTIGIVNDTVFAHGGVLPDHVTYGVDRINDEVRAWMIGDGLLPFIMQSQSAPTWTRHYSAPPPGEDPCPLLEQALEQLGAQRMVLGHTVQRDGIASHCDGKLWLIDVGMASHYGGTPAALEIKKSGEVAILK